MNGDTVLVDVECLRCGAVHDAYAIEGPSGELRVSARDERCPNCYPRRTMVQISERESLA